ncbi:MAG: hypothetical protein IT243_06345 [Bacteroidia bacterium]|nr:hypothetical protein [Bacteroidia bacterium]
MRFFLTIFIAIYLTNNIFCQNLEWSNTTKIRGNSLYTTVIGENEQGIYLLRHRNKFLSKFVVIERYRHNLGLESSKSYLMKNSRVLYSDINRKGILIIKQIYQKKSKTYIISAFYLNNNFEQITNEKILQKFINHDYYSEPKVIVKSDDNHENYLILNSTNLSTKTKNFEYIIFDINLEAKIDKSIKLEKIYKINDVYFDLKFELKILAENKNTEKPFSDYYLIFQKSDSFTSKKISDSNYVFDKVKLIYSPVLRKGIISGFYTSSYKSGYEGQFWCSVADNIKYIKTPFSNEIIKETESDIGSHYGFIPTSYNHLKTINCTNGGIIKIIENSIVNKDQEILMLNGSPTAKGKYIFIYENMIIQNFDSTGKLIWENNVNKLQNSVNDDGVLGSVFISTTPSKIFILYNYPITNGGDVFMVSFNYLGEKKIQKLIDGNLYNALIIPEECKQISSNKIIVPVIKERKFALLKIQF